MSAVTRWVEFDVTASGYAGDGDGQACKGTRAFSRADTAAGDSFDIGPTTNRLHLNIDGGVQTYVTIASGTDLDPRFVARDITEKIHNLGKNDPGWDQAQCVWENGKIKVYSGSLGSGTSVVVVSGTNTAHLELGFGSKTETGGAVATNQTTTSGNAYNGGITVSGTYGGFFDEIYRVVISIGSRGTGANIGAPSKGGTNTYTGTITTGGVFSNTIDLTYSLEIDTSAGTTMGGGTGNVPKLSWKSTGSADDGGPIELLYPDYWYHVGTKGLMVKFTDAVFNTCQDPNFAWTILCTYCQYTDGANTQNPAGTALYIWSSSRGDDWSSALVTSSTTPTRLGTRGLYIKFTGDNNFLAGDEFYVVCTPPQPKSYDISNLNYGNVTVSTESPVKSVVFEIISGAVEMDTVKFGLQNHGTFSHHNAGNSDTKFRFGTVGPGNNAGTGSIDGIEWHANLTAADIDNDIPPSYLYATEDNLSVVATADDSEAIGDSPYMGMVSDPTFVNIKLGASEVGANSTINYRLYFDYS
jgi:hypothetical protein